MRSMVCGLLGFALFFTLQSANAQAVYNAEVHSYGSTITGTPPVTTYYMRIQGSVTHDSSATIRVVVSIEKKVGGQWIVEGSSQTIRSNKKNAGTFQFDTFNLALTNPPPAGGAEYRANVDFLVEYPAPKQDQSAAVIASPNTVTINP
jgi:hypothetical protein